MYTQPATTITPALVVYLIDASDSMNEPCGDTTKIALVNQALKSAIKDMVRRSIRDGVPQRRYKLAILAYSEKVLDVLEGIRELPEIVKAGVMPKLSAGGVTDTSTAFASVERLLNPQIASLQRCPSPLVCHLTDAQFTTDDPSNVIRRIQAMKVEDGPVLVENVYVADKMLRKPVHDWHEWGGVLRASDLANEYAQFLYQLSSPLPDSYRQNINNYGYRLQPGAALFFPGANADLVRLAFAASAATQLK